MNVILGAIWDACCPRKTHKTCYNKCWFGPVAQLVEQRIENPRVSGSIPLQATKDSP